MGTGAYLFFLFLNCRSFCTPNSQLLLLSSNPLSEKKILCSFLHPRLITSSLGPSVLITVISWLSYRVPIRYLGARRSGGGGKEGKITGRGLKILAQLPPAPHTHPFSIPSLRPASARQRKGDMGPGVKEGRTGHPQLPSTGPAMLSSYRLCEDLGVWEETMLCFPSLAP